MKKCLPYFFILCFLFTNSCASKPSKQDPNTSYPPQVPANFKEAPDKLICDRKTPTAIHWNFYANREAEWMMVTLGREGKDISIRIQLQNGRPEEFAFFNGAWKNIEDMKLKEIDEHVASNRFDFEENRFLAECDRKIRDHISNKNKPYETPIKGHSI